MTEAEWLACEDPYALMVWLHDRSSHRKIRLAACACCRGVWHQLVDSRSCNAIDQAEQHAEGFLGRSELDLACIEAHEAAEELEQYCSTEPGPEAELRWNAAEMAWSVTAAWQHVYEAPRMAQYCSQKRVNVVDIIHDVIGNVFRSSTVDPSWLTPTVINLSTLTYSERTLPSGELDTIRLVMLADALEDAGCNDDAILSHLRSPGPHVRGCWALDLILGKE